MCMCVLGGGGGSLWKKRNMRIFERVKDVWVVCDSILCEVRLWMLVVKEYSDFSLNDMMRDWCVCIWMFAPSNVLVLSNWVPPPDGVFKLNFDGSYLGYPSEARYRCIIQDGSGKVIWVCCDLVGIYDY